ncbi:MAG: hypothetical protein KDA75_08480 [Planctomycetaceae bacterium]|nr:hypothetical protein [Planctomycetaceae bacterium]
MRIDIQIDDQLSPSVRRFLGAPLADGRRTAVESTARDALADTIRLNPVDTARSRAAWVDALERLGGTPPAGWQGPQGDGEAEGRAAATLVKDHDRDQSLVSATNAVGYVGFLEYGTSRSRAFAMVRRSLLLARERLLQRLRRIFR